MLNWKNNWCNFELKWDSLFLDSWSRSRFVKRVVYKENSLAHSSIQEDSKKQIRIAIKMWISYSFHIPHTSGLKLSWFHCFIGYLNLSDLCELQRMKIKIIKNGEESTGWKWVRKYRCLNHNSSNFKINIETDRFLNKL